MKMRRVVVKGGSYDLPIGHNMDFEFYINLAWLSEDETSFRIIYK